MKLLIKKPYIFIGTLITAGVITVTGYNIIIANNTKETNKDISNTVYSNQNNNDDLQKQISELQIQMEDNKLKVSELQDKVNKLEDDNKEKENTIKGLQSKINVLNKTTSENKELKSTLNNTQEQLIKINGKIEEDEIKGKKIQELSNKRKLLQEEIKDLRENKLAQKKEESNTLSSKHQELSKKYSEIIRNLASCSSKVEIEELEKNKNKINEEISELNRKAENNSNEIVKLTQQINDKESELNQVVIDMAELK